MRDVILDLIKKEEKRQDQTLMMIPSENYTYPEVREAVGSVLMHKYAEGTPGKRYYQGNGVVDEVERLCQQRAVEAFELGDEWGVNVQPHSGAEANLIAISALLNPGEKIMSMYLPDGGHLSHGWQSGGKKFHLVSRFFEVDFYRVDEKTRLFDYEQVDKQAKIFKPKLIISGGTAYPREIDYQKMAGIARSVGAFYLADVAHEAGLIAGGVCRSPFPYADVVTLTTHKTLRGPRGALIFGKKGLMDKIDFAVTPGFQGGPHLNTIAGIAIALEKTKLSEFKQYAATTVENAQELAKELMANGFDVVSGGTDKHLVLVDLRSKKVSGWAMAWAAESGNIVINRNTVPNETASAYFPSGIRLGTPALTVRGMGKIELKKIARWLIEIVNLLSKDKYSLEVTDPAARKDFRDRIADDKVITDIREKVVDLCKQFPIPK